MHYTYDIACNYSTAFMRRPNLSLYEMYENRENDSLNPSQSISIEHLRSTDGDS
jgi:hypothetical protein